MRNGKRMFTSAFKAWLCEQASKPGVSVAGLALHHGVNANQLRHWMQLGHWQSRSPASVLLPVSVVPDAMPLASAVNTLRAQASIEIEFGGAVVRVRGGVDAQQLRLVLDALRP